MKIKIRLLVILVGLICLVPLSARPTAPESKNFKWSQEFRAGDCGSDTVSVVLDSNGNGHLASVSWTRTTHSGDYWWWSVVGQDAQKVQIWSVPYHRGPRMDDGHPSPRYHNDFDFNFPAGQFAKTAYVVLGSKC